MTLLITARATDPGQVRTRTRDPAEIRAALATDGVRFDQWPVRALPLGASGESVLAAYATEVAALAQEGPYPTVDVVRLSPAPEDPTWPERARTAREKFLEEHTHAEDEIRYFVEGGGAFYLRFDDRIHMVLCTEGDLISVPAGTRHWFDMGESPSFCAIRFFGTKDGWIATFTGDAIARSFPSYDTLNVA